jgi:hypothetical protein
MPPKTRIPQDEQSNERLNQTINPDKLLPKPLKIDPEIEKEIKSNRRTGSTGGSSSTKDAEIIGMEQPKKNSGSPSPSPLGHPKFPLNRAPMLKQVLASGGQQLAMPNSGTNNKPRLLNRERSLNSKSKEGSRGKKSKAAKNPIDLANLFKNMQKNKKRKSNKGISQSDLSSGTPIGIGNIGPPPIAIGGFGLPRGRHKKAATAFDYENLNNSFQVDRLRHNTITTTPSNRSKKRRKGSKKVRVS